MGTARAITIGAFDGVHLGHASLLAAARRVVGADGEVVAMTFDPHPQSVLRPGAEPARLSTARQRTAWLEHAGADRVLIVEPTTELLAQSPEAFLQRLHDEHRPTHIVEGCDFRFGHRRGGDVATLRANEQRLGYTTVIVDDVQAALTDGSLVRVKSSLVRWLVGHGRVRDAARLLGRPYQLDGTVVGGDSRGGSELGVATANLDADEQLLPADGIYVGAAKAPDGVDYPAAISIGNKPTFGPPFGENPRVCEAHLIGYRPTTDEYGWTLRLTIDDWLRDQIAFETVEQLVAQIHRDIAQVTATRVRPDSLLKQA
jgi:riboflavin kinase/FMN adenylyltransferase